MEIATLGRAVLFDRAVQLGINDTAMDTNEEKVNMCADNSYPRAGEANQHKKAYVTHAVRELTIRRQWVTESLTRQTITLRENTILSNSIAGGMDAGEGFFVWNYTVRGCDKENL
jgi:hypothetical protein